MSFPEAQFRQFADILLEDLRNYVLSQYLFLQSCGLEEQALESLYAESFRAVFSQYENDDILDKLQFAGRNVSYAIYAYTHMQSGYSLQDLLEFVETFVLHQLNNFLKDYELPEWSDENYESYYKAKEQKQHGRQLLGDVTNVRRRA
jgi:hypothetical protein